MPMLAGRTPPAGSGCVCVRAVDRDPARDAVGRHNYDLPTWKVVCRLSGMETRKGPHDPPVPSTDARAALAAVADCNRQMAKQMRAPWWYHVGVGGLAGCLCLSVTLSPLEVLATL